MLWGTFVIRDQGDPSGDRGGAREASGSLVSLRLPGRLQGLRRRCQRKQPRRCQVLTLYPSYGPCWSRFPISSGKRCEETVHGQTLCFSRPRSPASPRRPGGFRSGRLRGQRAFGVSFAASGVPEHALPCPQSVSDLLRPQLSGPRGSCAFLVRGFLPEPSSRLPTGGPFARHLRSGRRPLGDFPAPWRACQRRGEEKSWKRKPKPGRLATRWQFW